MKGHIIAGVTANIFSITVAINPFKAALDASESLHFIENKKNAMFGRTLSGLKGVN